MHAVETPNPEQIKGVKEPSPAALRVLAAREQVGNGSEYDDFLCGRTGEVAPLSPHFPPIDRVAPSGRQYTYNNPHLVRNSFSQGGLLINYREASQPLVPGEEAFAYSIATLDLRTHTRVDWQIVSLDQQGTPGLKTTRLGLVKPAAASAVDQTGTIRQAVPTGEETLADAWLIIDPQGSSFVSNGRWEVLEPMDRLVAEVNTLTEARGLQLDEIRNRAAEVFGRAVVSLPIGA